MAKMERMSSAKPLRGSVYKVEWLEKGRGVNSILVGATNAEFAKSKVKRYKGIPKSQQVATKLYKKGQYPYNSIDILVG